MLHKFHMYTEQNRTILIIKSETADLSAAEKFIVKRDWTVHSCSNLNEAIFIIVREKPQFIMVSVDHSNKNIIAFIQILLQTFPERVIVFGEKPNPLTYRHFNETKCRYNIYPPVTGPAIERILLSYYKNQLGTSTPVVKMFNQTFKFNKIQKNEAWVFKGEKPQKTKDITLSMAKASEMFSVVNEAKLGKVTNKISEENNNGEVKTTAPEVFSGTVQNAASESGWGKVQKAPPKHVHESLMSLAAAEALEKTVLKSQPVVIEEIKFCTDMSCIMIQSTRFSGYLIAALGDNRKADDIFIQALRDSIFEYLKDNGEKINESNDPLHLVLKQVDFKGWVAQQAEFVRNSVHDQDEISIAFFPRQKISLNLEDSADEKMAKVRMTEIKADVEVEFDLYIHLEENNRYVRYTKKGAKFLSAQKQRLESQGLQYMHLFKTDIPEFNKYRAQNFLNENIEQFESLLEA